MDQSLVDMCDMRSAADRVESQMLGCLVRQAGAVLTGTKPSALFNLVPRDDHGRAPQDGLLRMAERCVDVYAEKTRAYGVELVELGILGGRLSLFAYRARAIDCLLADGGAAGFLIDHGYGPDLSTVDVVDTFVRRMRAYQSGTAGFPHEVGLLLGYPLQDVEGFIVNGGANASACGLWKAYGDVTCARRRLDRAREEERRASELYVNGWSLRQILRIGVTS
jgi:hypothetical protein